MQMWVSPNGEALSGNWFDSHLSSLALSKPLTPATDTKEDSVAQVVNDVQLGR